MATLSTAHKHKFTKPIEQKVLLASYRPDKGEVKYVTTSGYDIIKQWQCSNGNCDVTVAYDLERTVV